MDLSLNKEQQDIQKAAREFAQGEFDPDLAMELEKKNQYPLEIWKRACDLGFIGMHIPERYGGQDLGLLEHILVMEEFCRHNSGIGIALALCSFGSEMILRFGNGEQKEKYLPIITRGEGTSSLAYLEKGMGKESNSFRTIASKTTDGYFVSGEKSFVINGSLPGFMIALCQLADSPKRNEQVALIIEKDADSPVTSEMKGRIGMRMLPLSEHIFDNLEVSRKNLIGEEGQGSLYLMSFLSEANILAAAMGTGIAQGAFDLGLTYAKQREQFGEKIGFFEAIRDKLADMAMKIEIARTMTYKAALTFHNNSGDPKMTHMAKMISAKVALEVAKDSLHIFGGYGYIVENRIEQFYRDASMVEMIGIPEGMNKSFIAEKILGKIHSIT